LGKTSSVPSSLSKTSTIRCLSQPYIRRSSTACSWIHLSPKLAPFSRACRSACILPHLTPVEVEHISRLERRTLVGPTLTLALADYRAWRGRRWRRRDRLLHELSSMIGTRMTSAHRCSKQTGGLSACNRSLPLSTVQLVHDLAPFASARSWPV
jgi:hypothetical protein